MTQQPTGRSAEYVDPLCAANYLGVTTDYLAHLRTYGGGPTYSKLGHRSVRYRLQDLDHWMAERAMEATFRPRQVAEGVTA